MYFITLQIHINWIDQLITFIGFLSIDHYWIRVLISISSINLPFTNYMLKVSTWMDPPFHRSNYLWGSSFHMEQKWICFCLFWLILFLMPFIYWQSVMSTWLLPTSSHQLLSEPWSKWSQYKLNIVRKIK